MEATKDLFDKCLLSSKDDQSMVLSLQELEPVFDSYQTIEIESKYLNTCRGSTLWMTSGVLATGLRSRKICSLDKATTLSRSLLLKYLRYTWVVKWT